MTIEEIKREIETNRKNKEQATDIKVRHNYLKKQRYYEQMLRDYQFVDLLCGKCIDIYQNA